MKNPAIYMLFTFAAAAASCASTPIPTGAARPTRAIVGSLPQDAVPTTPSTINACRVWQKATRGHISHISLSADGSRLLLATSAEGRDPARLHLFDAKGRQLFTQRFPQPIKGQDISSDGRMFVVNSYDSKVFLYVVPPKKKTPRLAWTRDHLGRPLLLEKAKRIVIFNDDDSEHETAFVSYDYPGNRKAAVPTRKGEEAIDMFSSVDEEFLAVTTSAKKVLLFSPDGKALAQNTFESDPIAVAGLGGAERRVFTILSKRDGNGRVEQELAAFTWTPAPADAKADAQLPGLTQLWSVALPRKFEILKLETETLFLYGNSPAGQALAAYEASTGKPLWAKSYAVGANYTSPVLSGHSATSWFAAAIDEGFDAGKLAILATSATGTALWKAAIEAPSGIYSFDLAVNGNALGVGAGDAGSEKLEYYSTAEPTHSPCTKAPPRKKSKRIKKK